MYEYTVQVHSYVLILIMKHIGKGMEYAVYTDNVMHAGNLWGQAMVHPFHLYPANI